MVECALNDEIRWLSEAGLYVTTLLVLPGLELDLVVGDVLLEYVILG